MAHPSSYMNQLTGYGEKTKARASTLALQQLEAARARDVEMHARNLPALENNKAVAALIIQLNEAVGMPTRWSERDRNSRSRYPKTLTHQAGYLTDIARECKTDDQFDLATRRYESMKVEYDRYAAEGAREAEERQRQREREQQALIEKRKADIVLAGILLRYELPMESDWPDVLDHLRGKDQRIDLAVAMQQTRGDWSEGPYRVVDALGRFTITTNEDKDIAADVAGCLHNFSDGRVFRDTTWSYDAIFATVADKQLLADVMEALAHQER